MKEENIVVRNVNKIIWRRFVALCKHDGVNTGIKLTELLKKHLKQEG